jgi:preprotein translocase subunit YajC
VNGGFLIILLAFGLMYVLLIRPQRARQQHQRRLLETVEPGDEVLTVGGLYGIVQSIDEEGDLIVEIAEGVHVRLARRSVATVVKPDADDGEDAEEADDEQGQGRPRQEVTSRKGPVTVPEDEAGLEATQRRLFGRRN